MSNKLWIKDQAEYKLRVKGVYPRKGFAKNADGSWSQTDEQASTKQGVPQWEVVCVAFGSAPTSGPMRVVVPAEKKPELEEEAPVVFTGFTQAVRRRGDDGFGVDYYADGIDTSAVKAVKAA